jgi:diguanylate cyclase (GGDEF)-like protein
LKWCGFVALDTGTLVAAVVVVLTLLSGLLALTWAQNRGVAGLGTWALCFILCAGAAALWGARGALPTFLSIDLANAMRLLAFGLGWRAARQFAGREGKWTFVLAPALLWLLGSRLPAAHADGVLAVVLSSWLIGSYALGIAGELWRGSRSGLRMARPAAILLAIHGAFFLARSAASLILADPYLSLDVGAGAPVHPVVIFEALVVAVALAFLLVSAAKEQLELQHREASHIDPLTGVANRRGFDAAVERMLARARRNGSSTALLLLDLDHFKAVNDTWGHQVGDHALQAVARALERELRGGDVAARLGGEEFAVALADSRTDEAAVVAERARRAVSGLDIRRGDAPVGLSVSIGVAALRAADSLDALFARADAALYRAKAAGRNRVEFAPAPLALAEPDQVVRIAGKSRAA